MRWEKDGETMRRKTERLAEEVVVAVVGTALLLLILVAVGGAVTALGQAVGR